MKSAPASIVIRDIEGNAELREFENLQQQIWGVTDREVFPALATIPLLEVGAILVGAFSERSMIGFVFGFPGFEHGERIIHSDMLAVLPEFRSHGLGAQLKLAQREQALLQGIRTITWTFDPLQSRNANLNFRKLGVTSDRYCINYYGETTSFLHSTGTDRLWVKWQLTDPRVIERVERGESDNNPDANVPTILSVGRDQAPVSVKDVVATKKFLEVPGDINALMTADRDLALRWRKATRAAFVEAIGDGFIVDDFSVVDRDGLGVGRYLLKKNV